MEEQRYVDMGSVDEFVFARGASPKTFKVLYGNDDFVAEKLQPTSISMGNAYPNPFTQGVTLPFALPETLGQMPYEVEIRVYNLLGQELAHVMQQRFASGFYEAHWDGNTSDGAPLPTGTYLYTFKVIYPEGTYSATGRITKK